MSRYSVSPDLLFDRPWRAGHPFQPHCGRFRRWGMVCLLILLCLLIGGYDYLTDSQRVRSMAQAYLTDLVGGRVDVGGARLSVFEGLRLENVTVHVDEDGNAPDSVLFSAQAIVIRYDPKSMLEGRLAATQIVAESPRVLLAENVGDHSWNYQRLHNRNQRPRPIVPSHRPAVPLPEIMLRNAQVDLSEVRNGVLIARGSMAIDGHVASSADGQRYAFEMQSRGSEGIGPYVSGSVDYASGAVDANLRNFLFGDNRDFGHDVQAMLPAAVREWWERHRLAGRLDLPVVHYVPPRDGSKPVFRVETDLNGVTLTVGPEEWGGETAPSEAPPPLRSRPINLRQVSGVLIFTEAGITVADMSGRVENNGFTISGKIDGYRPAAPLKLRVSSLESENIYIPPSPRYIESLPVPVRKLYHDIRPQGTCAFNVELERDVPGSRPVVRGRIDVINGQFCMDKFPYPLRETTGRITFEPEPGGHGEMVHLVDLRGRGVESGPNRDAYVNIEGSVGPIKPGVEPACDVVVSGVGVASEPTLREAFPPEVRAAFKMLGANGADYPTFFGDFVTHVQRAEGARAHITFNTDVAIDDADGALVGFPYVLHHLRGNLKVRDGFVDIEHAQALRGEASVTIDGRVAFGGDALKFRAASDPPLQTMLRVAVRRMPIDAELLAAMPPDQRSWLERLGVKGSLDIDGTVWQPPLSTAAPPRSSTAPGKGRLPELSYKLQIAVADAELHPAGSSFAVFGGTGAMQLEPDHLKIESMIGRRGDAKMSLAGDIFWPQGAPQVALHLTADNLFLDGPLHDVLPAAAQAGWDELVPEGTIDADIIYKNGSPTTQPAVTGRSDRITAVLRPRELSITPVQMPYRLDGLGGTVTIHQDRLQLDHMTAHHGDAQFELSGTGQMGSAVSYDVQLTATKLMVDSELSKALPTSLRTIVEGLKLHGLCDARFPRLVYHAPSTTGDETHPASTNPEIDVTTLLSLRDNNLDVGVPLDHVNGLVQLDAEVRDQRVTSLHGSIDLASLQMAGRTLRQFRTDILKVPGGDELHLSKMQAELAGGELAGEVGLSFPEDGPSRYALNLAVRNADVRELAHDTDANVQGELTASLSLEGAWGDPGSRRGRGDVLVNGKEMYRIPLLLGLLQVTNLALPIAEPFHQGTVRYSMEGERVNFEQIELRSDTMRMNGAGHLDFATKQVRMSFTTDNPGGLSVPFLRDLWQGARNELLKINVKGTITQPKVETSMMGTFTTTVDEVLRGDTDNK